VARAEYDAAIAERDQALAQNHRLQHMLHQLQRMQPGRRSEKLDQDQLQLAFEDVEQAVAVTEAADDKHDPVGARECAEKCRANRCALPAHLPRIHVMIAPEDTNRACCRSPMHVIGEDVAERLDVIPGPVPGDRDAPVRLPGMRGGSGAGSCARAADQGRTSAASHAADGDHRLGWCLPFHVSSSASASLIGAEALWRK
jgi:Transposase C of IS166 homeodomain